MYQLFNYQSYLSLEPCSEALRKATGDKYKVHCYEGGMKYKTAEGHEKDCETYRKYRVKPEDACVIYETDYKTYFKGTISWVCKGMNRFKLKGQEPWNVTHYIDGEFDYDEAKAIVDDLLFNPNPDWN